SSSNGTITLADMRKSGETPALKPQEKEAPVAAVAAPSAPQAAVRGEPLAQSVTPAQRPAPIPAPTPAIRPAAAAPAASGGLYVQVSASGSEADSNRLKDRLVKKGGLAGAAVRLSPTVNERGARIYRVQVGPYATRAAADRK